MRIYKGKTPGKTLAELSLLVDDTTEVVTYDRMYHTNYDGTWKVEVDPLTHRPYKWYRRLWNWCKRNY